MVSETDICNNALLKLDARTITSLSDNTKEAVQCNVLYEQIRDDVLAAHPWNFAIRQSSLARLVATPTFEFDYKFTLPSDCLRVIKAVDSSEDKVAFKIKGRDLHSDESGIDIEYIKRVTDTAIFSPQFVDTLATRLAAELAYSLSGGETRAGNLLQQYSVKLKEAKRRDAQEGTADRFRTRTWTGSRD